MHMYLCIFPPQALSSQICTKGSPYIEHTEVATPKHKQNKGFQRMQKRLYRCILVVLADPLIATLTQIRSVENQARQG